VKRKLSFYLGTLSLAYKKKRRKKIADKGASSLCGPTSPIRGGVVSKTKGGGGAFSNPFKNEP